MTPEAWTVLVVGIGLAGLLVRMDVRIGRLTDHVRARGERLARLDNKVDTLISVFVKSGGSRLPGESPAPRG